MSAAYDLPFLGTVEIEDRLIEYDGPRLFTVRLANGGRFLGFWANDDPGNSVYWYCAISERRYRDLIRGDIDLRSIFVEPETHVVLETSWDENAEAFVSPGFKSPGELDPDALPESGFRLHVDEKASNFIALQLKRLVALVRFDFGRDDHEAPASILGGSITALQDALDAIGQALEGKPTERGPISEEITDKTALAFRTVFQGSFGIELAAEEASGLFGDSLASRSFESLIDLLEAGDDPIRLREHFAHLKGRSAKRYRVLLQNLGEAEADIDFSIGVPKRDGQRRFLLSKIRIPSIVAALYAADTEALETRDFTAELVGYNKRTRSFEVKNVLTQESYTGKVTGLGVDAARHATIGDKYFVRIAVTREYEPVIERETQRYELFELRDAPSAITKREPA